MFVAEIDATVCLCCQVGQIHGGLMGVVQRSMVKACPHVWFERSEVKDRHLVAKRYSSVFLQLYLKTLQFVSIFRRKAERSNYILI